MTRIVILISGRGSNMIAIAQACREQGWPAIIVGVLSNRPGCEGLRAAAALGLHAEAVDAAGFADRTAYDGALAARIDALGADLVVLAGYMRILSDAFVRRYAGRLLNIHPSLLPSFPGLQTHRRALEAGVRVHGATVHLVTAELDGGPIVAQAVVPVLEGDDEQALAERVLGAEHRLYPAVLGLWTAGRLELRDGRVRLREAAAGRSPLLLMPQATW